jgi:phosphoserine phosphatase
LSGIEGIDVLAERAGVGNEVSELTQQAMDGSTELESVYEKRLSTIQPTRGEIRALKEQYRKHLTEDATAVVAALHSLGHEVYIVSGGLIEPIVEIGTALGIPGENIKAVEIQYDEFSGEWWLAQDALHGRNQPFLKSNQSALEKTHGKAGVIEKLLCEKRGKSMLIGDGTSDLVAGSAVDLFVGYTGIVERERIVNSAPVLLKSRSLAPILLLSAGMQAVQKLEASAQRMLVRKACRLIEEGSVEFNDKKLGERFRRSYRQRSGSGDPIFR